MRHKLFEYQLVADSYTLPLVGEDGERKSHTLRKGDFVYGYKRKDENFLFLVAVMDNDYENAISVYDPIHGAADKSYFKATGRKMIRLYDDSCDGLVYPCDVARVDFVKPSNGWIKVDKEHTPGKDRFVIGLWGCQGMFCYVDGCGNYFDMFHGCYCAPPMWYSEIPKREDIVSASRKTGPSSRQD